METILSVLKDNLVGLGIAAIAGGLLSKFYYVIIAHFWPESFLLQLASKLDDNIDKFKIQNKEAGEELEKKLTSTLNKMIQIINDEQTDTKKTNKK